MLFISTEYISSLEEMSEEKYLYPHLFYGIFYVSAAVKCISRLCISHEFKTKNTNTNR